MKEKERAAPSRQEEEQAHKHKNKIVLGDNKPQLLISVVIIKALFLLDKHATQSSNGFIRLPEVRRVWSWLLHLSAEEVYLFLKELEGAGLVSRLNSHGIKIIKNQEGGK